LAADYLETGESIPAARLRGLRIVDAELELHLNGDPTQPKQRCKPNSPTRRA
jgi:hypothetical protein